MSPDERDEPFLDDDEEEPRSLISSLWFRLALAVAAVAVIAVIVVPRALDWINPASTIGSMKPVAGVAPASPTPTDKSVVTLSPTAPPAPSPSAGAPTSAPAEPSPAPVVAKTEEPPATAMPVTRSAPSTPVPSAAKLTAPAEVEPRARGSVRSAGIGDYWVQVAAFQEPKGAARLATQLRGQNFSVAETTATLRAPAAKSAAAPTPAPSRYDVVVAGVAPADIAPKLTSSDLTAEAAGNDVIVKPSLPLSAATDLSKTLAAAGYRVQVRRAPAGEPERVAARTGASEPMSPVYRVRVGPFPDRPAAVAALQELEAKGYKPFIAKGQP